MKNKGICIRYYPIRGKAQVCRLLCEFLQVEYTDELYTIRDWEKLKQSKSKTSELVELPHLKEGNFYLAGSIPMCLYIIERFSNGELLGRNLKDQSLIDMYIWTIDAMTKVININCQKKSQKEIEDFKEVQWKKVVFPKLSKYEEFCRAEDWFMGYLTIIDFSIYELMRYMHLIFGEKSNSLPKLKAIEGMIGSLSAIKYYETSSRAIKEMCPTSLLKQMKEKIGHKEETEENFRRELRVEGKVEQ